MDPPIDAKELSDSMLISGLKDPRLVGALFRREAKPEEGVWVRNLCPEQLEVNLLRSKDN